MILKAAFQIEKFIFLYAIIASPSHSKKDKQIYACIEWIAFLMTELKKLKQKNPKTIFDDKKNLRNLR